MRGDSCGARLACGLGRVVPEHAARLAEPGDTCAGDSSHGLQGRMAGKTWRRRRKQRGLRGEEEGEGDDEEEGEEEDCLARRWPPTLPQADLTSAGDPVWQVTRPGCLGI